MTGAAIQKATHRTSTQRPRPMGAVHSSAVCAESTIQHTEHFYDTANRLTAQSWMLGNRTFTGRYVYDGPATVAHNDDSLERDAFEAGPVERHIPGSGSQVPVIVTAAVALTSLIALVTSRPRELLGFWFL